MCRYAILVITSFSLLSSSCKQEQIAVQPIGIDICGVLHPEWKTVASFRNTHQPGCALNGMDITRYGMPYYLQADESGIVALLRRTASMEYNTGLLAMDWEGTTLWCTNNQAYNETVFGIFTINLCDNRVVTFTRDPLMIREFDRFSGDSLEVHAISSVTDDYRSGCFQNMTIGSSAVLFSSYFSVEKFKVFSFSRDYCLDSSSTEAFYANGIEDAHALTSQGDKYYIARFDDAVITICDKFGNSLEQISLNYERVKSPRLYLGNEYLYLRTPIIEQIQAVGDSLFVLVGTGAFATDSSEILIIDIEEREATTIPFPCTVNSFAVCGGKMVVSKTNITYGNAPNWEPVIVEEETELCVAYLD